MSLLRLTSMVGEEDLQGTPTLGFPVGLIVFL